MSTLFLAISIYLFGVLVILELLSSQQKKITWSTLLCSLFWPAVLGPAILIVIIFLIFAIIFLLTVREGEVDWDKYDEYRSHIDG